MKYEIYKDSAGEFRWRLKAANGYIIAVSSEGYTDKRAAEESILLVKKASNAPVEDKTNG